MIQETEKKQPIQRHEALKPLSREHHHGLLLCWKIREGFRRDIPIKRIKAYTDWFWKNQLQNHFQIEELHIFSIIGNKHEMVKKALSEHRRLKRLFEDNNEISESLSLIEEELEKHIRFEERILFNEIQKVATPEQLSHIESLHIEEDNCDSWKDEFWK